MGRLHTDNLMLLIQKTMQKKVNQSGQATGHQTQKLTAYDLTDRAQELETQLRKVRY